MRLLTSQKLRMRICMNGIVTIGMSAASSAAAQIGIISFLSG